MEFDIKGNLMPYEIIYTDLATFKRELVDAFPHSRTRQHIFQNFAGYIEKLTALIGTDFYQWIDGSFVTRKLDPRDIDVVTFVDADVYNKCEQGIQLLRDYNRDHQTGLDEYFVKHYPELHRKNVLYQMDIVQWYTQFCTSRTGARKGFIQLNY
ncbi:DUF6932 family protein [Dyadobacter sandarakinus]|uniref:Nucleotidyltransferase n=1 Tax=Dyadobacter sandarakinus TaxID=2747268 RepID=A0ABX7I5N6_9BACT|nr:hypothetical protein [Dyadobacter sandarakinus]QRR01184.1 hypothetical protein HWI92_09840 [Dyadobacter sandarakinus]